MAEDRTGVVARLDALEAAHNAIEIRVDYPSRHWLEQNPDEPHELARHTDTLSYTRDDDTVRLGCRCGHERGTVTKRELAADLDGRMRTYRLHVADAVIAVLNGPQSPPSHAGRAEGVGRMYSGGSRSGLTSQDETEGRR